jgi:CheY-like chemotaxis protein
MHSEISRVRRVIVVDRDPKLRALAERALRAPEFQAYTFASGSDALAEVDEIGPDCVVSDALLPDMQCELFLSTLRARPGLEAVPAVAMAVTRSEARIRAVLDAGFDAYVLKPFPLRELLGKVRSLLPAARASVASAARAAVSGETPTVALAAAGSSSARDAGKGAARARSLPATPPAPAAAGGRQGLWSKVASQGGRYTRVDRNGRSLVVLTEAKARPHFVITTVITEKGWALRKVSTELPYALARDDDRDLVRQQIELQHEAVLQNLDALVLDTTSRRVVWSRGLVP